MKVETVFLLILSIFGNERNFCMRDTKGKKV